MSVVMARTVVIMGVMMGVMMGMEVPRNVGHRVPIGQIYPGIIEDEPDQDGNSARLHQRRVYLSRLATGITGSKRGPKR
jgi:hypothetical protein